MLLPPPPLQNVLLLLFLSIRVVQTVSAIVTDFVSDLKNN